MDLFNFGRQQLQDGSLNGMLEQVGIDDVGSFVDQFRGEAHSGASSGGSGSSGDMIQGAISAYKAFSGGKGSGGGGGGNLLDNIGKNLFVNSNNNRDDPCFGKVPRIKMLRRCTPCTSNSIKTVMERSLPMMWRFFWRNWDSVKFRLVRILITLSLSTLTMFFLDFAKAIFASVDQNHNGSLDFTDMMALLAMLNKLSGQFGGLPQNWSNRLKRLLFDSINHHS